MGEQIHDDEPDTSEGVVRSLLKQQCPQWADAPIEYLQTSGTDNAMWRLRLEREPDVVVRLPRRLDAAAKAQTEVETLRRVGASSLRSLIATPRVVYEGEPTDRYPHHWSILEWLDGTDTWAAGDPTDPTQFATDLAAAITEIRSIDPTGAAPRQPGQRGGPLAPLLDGLDRWLTDPQWNANTMIDVAKIRRHIDQAREFVDAPVESGFVHGDLIPGNLLVRNGALSAIIDWGGAGFGDIAQDLAPAWAVVDPSVRAIFREALGVDDVTWIRGRVIELGHAVGGVLYYVPKGHQLGDIMARTLDRILAEPM